MAPSIKETEGDTAYIAASYIDKDRLYLVFSVNIDADLPPLPADLCVVENNTRINVVSLDIQLDQAQSVVVLLLETAPALGGGGLKVRYRPTQWMMSIEDSGDAIEAFDEAVFPQPVDLLDASLRLKSKLEPTAPVTSDAAKTVDAKIRSASEYRIQLHFTESLDASMPLEVSDFRAELEDRWLDITRAKYVRSDVDDMPEIRLELSEPMPSGCLVKVGYRSPSSRLRTQYAETVAPFNVEAVVDRNASSRLSDEESDLESVAVTTHLAPAPSAVAEPLPDDEIAEPAEIRPEQSLAGPAAEEALDSDETADIAAVVADDEAVEEPSSELALAEDPLAGLDDLPEDWLGSDLNEEPLELAFAEDGDVSREAAPSDEAAIAGESDQTPAADDVAELESADSSPAEIDTIADEAPNTQTPSTEAPGTETSSTLSPSPLTPSAAIAAESLAKEGDAQPPQAEKTLAESIAEKTARIQKALESKTDLPVARPPLTLTAKIIYGIPIVVFAWLLVVVCIYVVTIVFDVKLGGTEQALPEMPASVTQRIPNETCSMKSADGSRYEGQCYKGKREGEGVYTWASGNHYEGQWMGGQRHGKGRLTYASGAVYEGEYRAGVEHGFGSMTWPNGAKYEGEYGEGKFHGRGVYISADGSRFEGIFDRGSMTQNGTCTLATGETHPGACQSQ